MCVQRRSSGGRPRSPGGAYRPSKGILDVGRGLALRACRTRQVERPRSLEVVGKMLGHRNYHTTQRYAHIADNVLRDAVNMTSKTIVQAGQDGTSKGRKAPKSRSRKAR